MFSNLKCLREGSFQITINNLHLHLPLCKKGVIYGCIERSFMTLYDFKERPLMNVPPVECSSSSLFYDFSYAPQYHSLSHNNVCWLQYSLAVWDCVNCFMIPDLQWYSQRKNTMVAEFPASRISGNNSPSIHFTAWKGNFLITTCASWAILATSRKKWPPRGRLERNTF